MGVRRADGNRLGRLLGRLLFGTMVTLRKAEIDPSKFNRALELPYELRILDFQSAMQDVYDFFYDVNLHLLEKGLRRLDDFMRPANLSGTLSDMVTESLGKHSRILTENLHHNGHPDLIVRDRYPGNAVKAGEFGVEIKSTRKRGGAVDTHGARNQTLSVWVYEVDNDHTRAAHSRAPLRFSEIYIATVTEADFRRNERGVLGTRTATLDKEGVTRFREGWVYLDHPEKDSDRLPKSSQWRSGRR